MQPRICFQNNWGEKKESRSYLPLILFTPPGSLTFLGLTCSGLLVSVAPSAGVLPCIWWWWGVTVHAEREEG